MGDNIDLVLRKLYLPRTSADNVSILQLPFSEAEIQAAMFSLGDDKSPGLDGFPAASLKTYWNSIGPYVIATVSHFFAT